MADYRPIKISIWDDEWFFDLTAEEKTVWFFLLTNKSVHVSGIYQLPKPLISPYVGVTKGEIDRILEKFEADGKIVCKKGWIFIRNYLKNQIRQFTGNDNILKSIRVFLHERPELVKLFSLQNEAPYKPLISPLVVPSGEFLDPSLNVNVNRNVNGNGNLKCENEDASPARLSTDLGDNSPRSRMTKGLDESRRKLVQHLDMDKKK